MFNANGNIPVCPLAIPTLFLKYSVASYMSIGPPFDLVNVNLSVPVALVVALSPDTLLEPT